MSIDAGIAVLDWVALAVVAFGFVWSTLGWLGRVRSNRGYPRGSRPAREFGRSMALLSGGLIIDLATELLGQHVVKLVGAAIGLIVIICGFVLLARWLRRYNARST
ncbi:MAG TPA: hypothetical protein VJ914_02185 [Pseudonocardiaceae bacterium]|nr:hypothetical protein [Pseudonocardiaceae bacterium]